MEYLTFDSELWFESQHYMYIYIFFKILLYNCFATDDDVLLKIQDISSLR